MEVLGYLRKLAYISYFGYFAYGIQHRMIDQMSLGWYRLHAAAVPLLLLSLCHLHWSFRLFCFSQYTTCCKCLNIDCFSVCQHTTYFECTVKHLLVWVKKTPAVKVLQNCSVAGLAAATATTPTAQASLHHSNCFHLLHYYGLHWPLFVQSVALDFHGFCLCSQYAWFTESVQCWQF